MKCCLYLLVDVLELASLFISLEASFAKIVVCATVTLVPRIGRSSIK